MVKNITPQELKTRQAQDSGLRLIDVRTLAEFQEVHVEFAKNVPLDRLNPQEVMNGSGNSAEKPLYVICKSGSRGRMACEKLASAGYEHVLNVEGGTNACVEAGLPVRRGKSVMSLERQVRVAAGSLVLLGAVLGLTVHPYWIGLSGFVGAGLIFAGLTDTCGMGMLIARMPWNQTGPACCSK